MALPALAAVGAIGSILAPIAGDILTNRLNAGEAKKNRTFQREMSSSSYQRSMADMRAAGLNPILAAKNAGASTPGGATSVSMQNPARALEKGISSAMQLKRFNTELQILEQQLTQQTALADKAWQDADISRWLNLTGKRDMLVRKAQQPGLLTAAQMESYFNLPSIRSGSSTVKGLIDNAIPVRSLLSPRMSPKYYRKGK